MFHVVSRSLHLIGSGRRRRWIVLIVLAVVASGLEMLGAALVYVLVGLVSAPSSELSLPVVGDIRRFAEGIDEQSLLISVAGAMAIFFLVRAVAQIGITYAQQRVAHREGARLANRLANGYLALPYAFHLRRNTADLIRNANGAVNTVVSQAFIPMIQVAAEAILTIGLLTIMLLVSPVATVIAIVVVGGAGALLLFVVQPRLKRIGRSVHEMTKATLQALQEPLHGLRDVKLLGKERAFAIRYAVSRNQLARGQYLKGTVAEMPRHVMETALLGFILIFFAFAIISGTATEDVLSVLGLFAYAGLRLQPSLTRMIKGMNSLKFATAPVDEVYADLQRVEGLRPPNEQAPRSFTDELALRDVAFRYDETDEDALADINITIRRGETVGVCGATGGGKTTLVDLMTGLLDPTAGRITIDGRDLGEDVRGWQRNLGVVPQMVFLTDDTLRRNIALGVPDEEIDEGALAEAVKLAQLDEFVDRLPVGLETTVGERGVRVSGGQRQRVAIARALYRRAAVLVFDEGTSALDNSTESQLMTALEQLRGEHTIILVAHRLTTVRNCDRIIYLEAGRIAGVGTYESLVADNSGFRALAASS